jgi:hypothetical protein
VQDGSQPQRLPPRTGSDERKPVRPRSPLLGAPA